MAKKEFSNKSALLIIFMVVFIDLVGFGIVIPILPYYAKSFGANATTLGLLMMSYSLLQFLFAPVWGRISDRVGRRPVLLISMFTTAGAMVLLGLAKSLVWIFAARILGGAGSANISTAAAYIADVTDEKNRAKGMGLIGAAFGLGFIFGPAIGGLLSRYGYPAPMFAAAAIALANIVFALFKLPEPPISEAERAQNRTRRFDLALFRRVLTNPLSGNAILLFFVITLAFTAMEVTYALFMLERHGFNAQKAGMLLAMVGIIMAGIQGGLIGKLSKRFGEKRLVIFGTLVMSVGLTVAALTHNLFVVIGAMALIAVGNGVNNPSLMSLTSKGAAPGQRGMVMGVYQSAGSLARVLGPPMAGWLFDHMGNSSPFLFAASLILLACIGASRWHIRTRRQSAT